MISKNPSHTAVYWTAFVGLFFDYYDLYLFVYLEKTLAADFGLGTFASNTLQFSGLAGVGVGALVFGYLADRFGRARLLLAVFGVYSLGIAGLSVAWNLPSLLTFRVLASLALGAEWGISHAFMAEHVDGARRYRYAALLQFSILGGLLAALATRFMLPHTGWRLLFAASLVPVALLSLVRWRWLLAIGDTAESNVVSSASAPVGETDDSLRSAREPAAGAELRHPAAAWQGGHSAIKGREGVAFAQCFGIASLTIASGTVNVFFAKELPQSPLYTVLFWANVAPGMLFGAWVVRRAGVRRALMGYAAAVVVLSGFAWFSPWSGRQLAFALVLPLLNGIPFGLMGAYFNEVFARYRTALSGAAYNLGRIVAGFSPALITALGLNVGGRYFLFSAALGVGVLAIGLALPERRRASA